MADFSPKPWFVIAGGGTGGHLYPGLAVADALRAMQPGVEVVLYGTQRPLDRNLAAARQLELVAQEVRPFPNKPWQWPGFLRAWMRSVGAARAKFSQRPPCAVLGVGGYAAGPPVIAARKLRVPCALFNPDATPGRANRRLTSKVDRVFVQWEQTAQCFPDRAVVRCTGCPVRSDFGNVSRLDACHALGLDPAKKTLLVTGASQGAHSINLTMLELKDLWQVATHWQLLHLTGLDDEADCRRRYQADQVPARVIGFTERMAVCMAAADLVVSRAGASTLAEITAVGLPSVLMPYPFDRPQHQRVNAQVLVEAGAAELVEDRVSAPENAHRLRDVLRDLMRSDEHRRRMARSAAALGRTDAADNIAAQLLEMARRGA